MRLERKKAEIVTEALSEWGKESLISPEQAQQLKSTIEVIPIDWRRLARYSFIVAICAIIISIGAIVTDKPLMHLIETYLGTPASVKALSLLILSGIYFAWGVYRKQNKPEMVFRNEAIFFLGIITFAGSLYYVGEFFQMEWQDYRTMVLVAFLSYGILALVLQSTLIWIFALLSLGSWMGAETGYLSGWGSYYLGMNYPMRFVIFGAILTLASPLLGYVQRLKPLEHTTLVMGLGYLFIALWILSIFGNYNDVKIWREVSQIELFHYGLLFGAAALAAIAHGLKYDNATTRGFGLVFLFINLYTRFFDYFWNPLHKAIFFAILGASLWFLGTHAEKIWNFQLDRKKSGG